MSTSDLRTADKTNTETVDRIFEDPVAYLARFGIDATLAVDTTLPAAA